MKGLNEDGLAKIRNEKLGFVFQDFMLLDGLTVRENILVPRIIQGKVDTQAALLADQLMSLFGIDHIRSKYPADISGGERQRTAVARIHTMEMNRNIIRKTAKVFRKSFWSRIRNFGM